MKSALLWVGLLWPMAGAAEEGVQQASLEHLVGEALSHNPVIQAARQRWESGQTVIPQVQTLPDPRLSVGYRDLAQQREVMYGIPANSGSRARSPRAMRSAWSRSIWRPNWRSSPASRRRSAICTSCTIPSGRRNGLPTFLQR